MARRRKNIDYYNEEQVTYYREQLFRELTHLFKWNGLPETIPVDYLERNLIRYGKVLFYEDENIGLDVLRCEVTGYNRHEQPVTARTFTPNTTNTTVSIMRNIKRLTDGLQAVDNFDTQKDGVLIQNMELAQSVNNIVEHYARDLAMSKQAFNTNLLWSNIPYIFLTDNNETKLSYERLFDDIASGKPAIIVDKKLLLENKDRAGVPTGIPFMLKDLLDVMNEINMQFRQTVGFDTAGVDKAERVNTLEIESNEEHTTSVLDIMLQQRRIAAKNINAFYGLNVTVGTTHEITLTDEIEEVEGNGTDDSGIEDTIDDGI